MKSKKMNRLIQMNNNDEEKEKKNELQIKKNRKEERVKEMETKGNGLKILSLLHSVGIVPLEFEKWRIFSIIYFHTHTHTHTHTYIYI